MWLEIQQYLRRSRHDRDNGSIENQPLQLVREQHIIQEKEVQRARYDELEEEGKGRSFAFGPEIQHKDHDDTVLNNCCNQITICVKQVPTIYIVPHYCYISRSFQHHGREGQTVIVLSTKNVHYDW